MFCETYEYDVIYSPAVYGSCFPFLCAANLARFLSLQVVVYHYQYCMSTPCCPEGESLNVAFWEQDQIGYSIY
jgi:hypothetical protein